MKQIKCSTGKQEFLLVEVPVYDKYNLDILWADPTMDRSGGVFLINRVSGGRTYIKKIGIESDFTAPNQRKITPLGLYTPSTGEINFEVREEWVENMQWQFADGNDTVWKAYDGEHIFDINPKQSFIGFLKSVTDKEIVEKWAVILINN